MRSHLLAACVGDVIAFFRRVERERRLFGVCLCLCVGCRQILPIVVFVFVVVVVVSTPTNLFMHVCAIFPNIYIYFFDCAYFLLNLLTHFCLPKTHTQHTTPHLFCWLTNSLFVSLAQLPSCFIFICNCCFFSKGCCCYWYCWCLCLSFLSFTFYMTCFSFFFIWNYYYYSQTFKHGIVKFYKIYSIIDVQRHSFASASSFFLFCFVVLTNIPFAQ